MIFLILDVQPTRFVATKNKLRVSSCSVLFKVQKSGSSVEVGSLSRYFATNLITNPGWCLRVSSIRTKDPFVNQEVSCAFEITPLKINMEPKNHPIEKENHLQNFNFLGSSR